MALLRRISTKPAEWAYIVARVRVMSRKLIPREDYNKLLNMDIHEIARYLEESEYKREIDELAYKYSGMDLVDYALSLNLSRTYSKLIRISKGVPRQLIVQYLRRYDFWNLKNIIRGKMFGFPREEVEATLVIAGEYDEQFYRALMAKETIEDIVKTFEGKPFYPILDKLVKACPLAEFEDELDKFYYQSLTSISPETIDMKYFLEFIRMEIDIKNIKTILRLKTEGAEMDEIVPKIVPGGYQLKEDVARRLAAMELDELMKSLEGFWFHEAIKDVLREPLSRIEVYFDRMWAQKVVSKSHHFPLSILPVLSYMLLKKIEVDNLRILARGKAEGLPTEAIKEQLVIV
jgi:V/A-type H+-transporting ATPase subunit C